MINCSVLYKVELGLWGVKNEGLVKLSLLEWVVLGVEVSRMEVDFGLMWEVWLS